MSWRHAGLELAVRPDGLGRIVGAEVAVLRGAVDDRGEAGRPLLPRHVAEARVVEADAPLQRLLRREAFELVQGVGTPARAAARRAGEDEALDALRVAGRKLLGDHARRRRLR